MSTNDFKGYKLDLNTIKDPAIAEMFQQMQIQSQALVDTVNQSKSEISELKTQLSQPAQQVNITQSNTGDYRIEDNGVSDDEVMVFDVTGVALKSSCLKIGHDSGNIPVADGTLVTDLHAADSDTCGGLAPAIIVPVGVIFSYAGSTIPYGWLACNGASLLRAQYPDLFAAIGTAWGAVSDGHFNLPDLRGLTLRGVDGGAGRDPDRASRTAIHTGGATGDNVGSYEADAMQGHFHPVERDDNHVQTLVGVATGSGSASFGTGTAKARAIAPSTDGTNGTPRTASETRPKNVNVNFIIKY